MLLYWPELLYPYYSLLLFFPLSSLCGWGLRTDRVYITLSLALPTFFNNNNNNNNNYCNPRCINDIVNLSVNPILKTLQRPL